MIQEFEFYDGGLKVEIDITDEKKDAVLNAIIKYCKDNNCISGESLMQNDNCTIEAPVVLSEIIDDILKFESKWVGKI